MPLVLALVPALFWDAPPETAPALRSAGIEEIAVPLERLAAWKGVPGFAVKMGDPRDMVHLAAPSVDYRVQEASATHVPWLALNGWRFLRGPKGRFYYKAAGVQAALAAAEAFSFGGNAVIQADAGGVQALGAMLKFLRTIGDEAMAPVADIGYVDDGSPESGELMNLLVRDNLLFRVTPAPDRRLKIQVKLGTAEYPRADAKNPAALAHAVRANLGDERRSVRIYGSAVVVARLTGSGNRLRVHLLNYDGAERKVDGIRVRVLGRYTKHQVSMADRTGVELLEYSVDRDATEFTLPVLSTYAVVDLTR